MGCRQTCPDALYSRVILLFQCVLILLLELLYKSVWCLLPFTSSVPSLSLNKISVITSVCLEDMAGLLAEFLAPESCEGSCLVQFWTRGGNLPTRQAATVFLRARFADSRAFAVKVGDNMVSIFAHMWEEADASNLHGTVAWVGNTMLCCAQVDDALLHDEGPPADMPVIVFH